MKFKYAVFLLLLACSLSFADFNTGSHSSPASSYNQTNGNQKTQITDGTDVADVTASGELEVTGTLTGIAGTVTITDGSGPMTVDGTVAATQSGTWNITSVTNPVAVTGTFWQATQPVSGTFWQATQPVSGTVAATQSGTWSVDASGAAVPVTDNSGSLTIDITDGSYTANVKPLNVQVTGTDDGLVVNSVIHGLTTAGGGTYVDVKVNPSGALSVDASGSTLGSNSGVDIGDVTINNASGASAVNIQDGGNTITVDGTVTVTDGAGALNVIVDSGTVTANISGSISNTTFGATQATPTSLKAQVFGDDTTQALDVDASGQLQVDILTIPTTTVTATNLDVQIGGSDSLTIGTFPDNEPINLNQIGGSAVSTATTGVQKVGVVGNAGAVFDGANNASMPANLIQSGGQAIANGTQPSAATDGNARYQIVSLDGAQYVRLGGPVSFSCGLSGVANTLTQCQAAPSSGLSLYVTSWIAASSTATGGLMTLRYGTGANCGTGTGNLLANSASAVYISPANTVAPQVVNLMTPLKVPAANALCVLGVATNTTNITIFGFTAP